MWLKFQKKLVLILFTDFMKFLKISELKISPCFAIRETACFLKVVCNMVFRQLFSTHVIESSYYLTLSLSHTEAASY